MSDTSPHQTNEVKKWNTCIGAHLQKQSHTTVKFCGSHITVLWEPSCANYHLGLAWGNRQRSAWGFSFLQGSNSHSYNFTQGILKDRGQNATHKEVHSQFQGQREFSNITVCQEGIRGSRRQCWERDWWWMRRHWIFSCLTLHRK